MRELGKVYSCADKSKAYLRAVYNPDNDVVGFFLFDDESGETSCIALSCAEARSFIIDILEKTNS